MFPQDLTSILVDETRDIPIYQQEYNCTSVIQPCYPVFDNGRLDNRSSTVFRYQKVAWYQIIGAALCIAHGLESAHPQSHVVAHKLLICRFDVNFLHKNPIIGQIN